MAEDIKVTFIIPKDCENENECSEAMQLAFTTCEQHSGGGLQASWVHENQWKKFEGLTKRDVFVLPEFEGEFYEKLKSTKCLLVGPRCLSCCLMEGIPIPSGPEPVYTVAMRGLVITASGLTKEKKENIKRKVHWMGGIYSTVLTDDTTHLVSDTVLSDKYIKSVEKGIPIMHEAWIEAVWEASLHMNVNGSSADFDVHRLPPFANLQITTSGIPKRDKQAIMKLVNENGGVFSGAFQSETTDVVVLTQEGMGSEKYKAALEYGKACVAPAWVRESARAQAALPLARYRVAGACTSSPLAEHRLPNISLNFSRITNVRPPGNFVDETRPMDISTMSGKMKMSQEQRKSNESSMDKELQTAFENFDMSLIKKAGSIFDGFCIWVSGVEGVVRERALACVSRCGAVRLDAPHARVTHAVAGSACAAAAARRRLPAAPALSPLWLLHSVARARALDEAEYIINVDPSTPAKSNAGKQQVDAASPMSKRNLQLLRREPLDLAPPMPEVEEPQDELVNHYLSQNVPENAPEPVKEKTPEPAVPDCTTTTNATREDQPDMTDDVDDPTEEMEQIFRGLKIEVQGLDEEAITEIGAEIAGAGGAVCGAGAGGTHVLVPLDFDTDDLTAAAEPVTVFWVKDCLSQQELVPIQYYHRPVRLGPAVGGTPPLRGAVISLSTYSGVERAFLDDLAKLLGATTQLRFCRRTTATALASTHLVCPEPAGDKYAGALKWGLPAVRAPWLLHCARAGARVPERGYLVGGTQAPPSDNQEKMEDETNEQAHASTDKENVMLPPPDPQVPAAQPRGTAPSRENTPKAKPVDDGDDMSPASRYIAMARQGLLGPDSQETPKRVQEVQGDSVEGGEVRTPCLEEALSTPNLAALSPRTRRRLQAVRRGDMPSDPPRTPTDPFLAEPPTPDSAFGAALRPGGGRLSPAARKRLWTLVSGLPCRADPAGTPAPPAPPAHTPLSEIRNRFLAQFNNGGASTPPPSEHVVAPRKLYLQDQDDTPPAKMAKLTEDQCAGGGAAGVGAEGAGVEVEGAGGSSRLVEEQLQRLHAALAARPAASQRARRSTRDFAPPVLPPGPESEQGPESQPNTVGWDDTHALPAPEPPVTPVKRFMLSSNVDNREEMMEMIQSLGGAVCEGAELDPRATHLLCAAPARSEKMLGAVAAGRWVLHPAYVARSRQAGRFLPEEEYEWGNPLAVTLPPTTGAERLLARAAHRWRVARGGGDAGGAGGEGGAGPFARLVALLHVPAPRRRLLARLVAAGGGRAPPDTPPYTNEEITVCFADIKRYPLSPRDAQWLVSRRIPVCAPVLLSSYLTDDVPPNPEEHCLPEYRPT